MKTLRLAVCASVLTSSAIAGIPAGRGEISLDAGATLTYDSNISGRQGSQDDMYGTFAPRVSYARRAGIIGADLGVGISSERYFDHTEYNSDNLSANAALRLSEKSYQNISASISANYSEGYQINSDINARIKSKNTTFNGAFGLVTGPRTHFDAHGSYSNGQNTGASDQQFLEGGMGFAYSDFLYDTSLHLTYGYTETGSSGDNAIGTDIDQNSHLISLGLSRPLYHDVTGSLNYGYRILNRSAAETSTGTTRTTGTVFSVNIDGPFLPQRTFPKIKSHASISYQSSTSPGINDPGTSKEVTGDIGLSWAARETTTVSIDVSRSQRLAVNDLSAVTTTANLHVTQQLRYNLSGSAGAGYNWNTFKGVVRSDEMFSADGSLSYSFARVWSADASYRYQKTKSDLNIADFSRHVATLSLGWHF